MSQPSNKDLLEKLEDLINKNSSEIRKDIQSLNTNVNIQIKVIEERCLKIEKRLTYIERSNKRNNIVIFGIQANKNNLLNTTIEKLNQIFGCDLVERDINNIYIIGNKGTVILEFVTFLTKQKIIQNLKKLKDEVPYTAEDLESTSNEESATEFEIDLPQKYNSAPPTPTIRVDEKEIGEEEEDVKQVEEEEEEEEDDKQTTEFHRTIKKREIIYQMHKFKKSFTKELDIKQPNKKRKGKTTTSTRVL
ncbi:unnamed protein product [Psylliodes chrysocephalus]|uniref:Uncharacterized protein n=1 Tax=Psylliodes chrysocephalus TaxID=3402493 RepID=A0A9P0D4Y9_9CUCU|nr:unnamed protein product [Psylliodes chrysocephala]